LQPVPAAIRALHVFVLLAFALAQPLFDLLVRHAPFLVVHRVDALDLSLIAFTLTLVIPGILAAAQWGIARVAGRGANAVHLIVVAALVAVIALPVLERHAGGTAAVLATGAAAMGVAAAATYANLRALRTFVTVLSPVLLLFPCLFLFRPPVSDLLSREASSAAPRGEVASDVPVVLVVFDGLPLRNAHWFRNATSVSDRTVQALPAILTGLYPWTKNLASLPTHSKYPHNLFGLLGRSYDMNVIEIFSWLCPPDLCYESPTVPTRPERLTAIASDLTYVYGHFVLPEEWTRSLPPIADTWANFAKTNEPKLDREVLRERRLDVPWIFSRFIEGIEDRGRPTLHFVHLNVPHTPYKYLPSGVEYGPGDAPTASPDERWMEDDWPVAQGLQRHLFQVAYADALLGGIVSRLEDEDIYDRALVIVTADHGESFRPTIERRAISPGGENARDILSIPLLIKLPNQREGRVSDRNTETIDILPTIMHVARAAAPWRMDGRSLFEQSIPERPEKLAHSFLRQDSGRFSFGRSLPPETGAGRRISAEFDLRRQRIDLFAIGPNRDLLDREMTALAVERDSPYRGLLANRSTYGNVDPEAGFLPARVTGFVEIADSKPVDLAVAVNGIVRSVTRSYGHTQERAPFAAMLPERSFRPGNNDIEIFAVEGRGEERVLLPVRTETPSP
jgi:hypothetical protein